MKQKKVEPIPNHTGVKVPGAGGALRPSQVKDVVEKIEERDLDEVKQAGGEEPW